MTVEERKNFIRRENSEGVRVDKNGRSKHEEHNYNMSDAMWTEPCSSFQRTVPLHDIR
jgi:hypothetical protein